ncbi:MAG: 16S rRNA (cytosine(1402)-N(4))-methyltransferase RsmH [Nanoarchaeota archaeon]|nr:16S rRNA (cytosine(1402)-N(4))-methyltransferase RsmH [Nanoarchaeota archaeon]
MMLIPVLLQEVIAALDPKPGNFIIDGTVGEGGHAKEIIKKIEPGGILLGIDWDTSQAEQAEKNIIGVGVKVVIAHGNYKDIENIQKRYGLQRADGLLLDLGFSSRHLESGKGFSFQKDEPLDMRYSGNIVISDITNIDEGKMTAGAALNTLSEQELADIFWKYGEERASRKIAKAIVEARKKCRIERTSDLVRIIGEQKRGKIHPATRTFQALRIYVNKELENLEDILKKIPAIVKPEGRVVMISFHSLEDRIIKRYFKTYEEEGIGKRINKKVIRPSREEIQSNPRSRSAKLRCLQIV